MQALLVPILAQVLAAGGGARTEVRYITSAADQRWESASSAGVGANFSIPHLSLSASYSPSVTITPLEETPRQVLVNDSFDASATADYGFRLGRGTLGFSATARYTMQNPVFEALNAPSPVPPSADVPEPPPDTGAGGEAQPPPANEPTNPAVNARPAEDARVELWSLDGGVNYSIQLSRRVAFDANAGYSATAGFGRWRRSYPLSQGPNASAEVEYRVSARGTLTTNLGAQYSWTETGGKGFIAGLGETYDHQFTRRLHGDLGAGVAYGWTQQDDGPIQHSLFPIASAGLDYSTRFAGGDFSTGARVTSAPVLDVTTASVDPRLGIGAFAAWSRRRLSMNADLATTLSWAGSDSRGALNEITGSYTINYDIGAGFHADAGVRAAWQTYEGNPVIPASAAFFAGIGWGIGGVLFGR